MVVGTNCYYVDSSEPFDCFHRGIGDSAVYLYVVLIYDIFIRKTAAIYQKPLPANVHQKDCQANASAKENGDGLHTQIDNSAAKKYSYSIRCVNHTHTVGSFCGSRVRFTGH